MMIGIQGMRHTRRQFMCIGLFACASDLPLASLPDSSTAAAIRAQETQALATWNVIALKATATGPFSPPRESRTMAMLSIAVFDAVNAIKQKYSASSFQSTQIATGQLKPRSAQHRAMSLSP